MKLGILQGSGCVLFILHMQACTYIPSPALHVCPCTLPYIQIIILLPQVALYTCVHVLMYIRIHSYDSYTSIYCKIQTCTVHGHGVAQSYIQIRIMTVYYNVLMVKLARPFPLLLYEHFYWMIDVSHQTILSIKFVSILSTVKSRHENRPRCTELQTARQIKCCQMQGW